MDEAKTEAQKMAERISANRIVLAVFFKAFPPVSC
jgi:hypothetical protein